MAIIKAASTDILSFCHYNAPMWFSSEFQFLFQIEQQLIDPETATNSLSVSFPKQLNQLSLHGTSNSQKDHDPITHKPVWWEYQ